MLIAVLVALGAREMGVPLTPDVAGGGTLIIMLGLVAWRWMPHKRTKPAQTNNGSQEKKKKTEY